MCWLKFMLKLSVMKICILLKWILLKPSTPFPWSLVITQACLSHNSQHVYIALLIMINIGIQRSLTSPKPPGSRKPFLEEFVQLTNDHSLIYLSAMRVNDSLTFWTMGSKKLQSLNLPEKAVDKRKGARKVVCTFESSPESSPESDLPDGPHRWSCFKRESAWDDVTTHWRTSFWSRNRVSKE